jgi:F-type H+-transporting ATPase subunit delta
VLAQEVAKKYAGGLFLSVTEKNLIEQAHDQLGELRIFLESDSTMLNFLMAPHVLDENKLALVRNVFTDRLERLLVEFLVVLVNKHRIKHLHDIIDEFIRIVKAKRGIALATVMTAIPINDAERQSLVEKLARRTGMTIELEQKIDPGIVAGMVIILHNEIIDGSVRHRLDVLEGQLAKVRVH